ncbi:MAG: hypothetical protein A2666_04460 [Parcubacteria group bacterium RIFCSPHIGHO2_01_FULL_47_10b]|nr:MAG: hypothetical protein A2666_04460 [Parcubacteria group bacterium RIFCSPHIGHO2_01_FULL_47_10b]
MKDSLIQANKLISQATNILVATPKNPSNDALAAALGLYDVLNELGKKPQLVATGASPEALQFLPSFQNIQTTLRTTAQLKITLDTKRAPVQSVTYDIDDKNNLLTFSLEVDPPTDAPRSDEIVANAVSTELIPGTIDLVITVGANNIEQLSDIQAQNKRLLYDTPLISIDNNPNNTQFGQVHLHKITSASLAEIVLSLITESAPQTLTPQAATALLAGIITSTRNFESARTTPDSFHAASVLLEHKADQQTIIKHLYRTKSLPLLKLWGRALGRLETKPELGLVHTFVTPDDFISSESSSKDVPQVVDEIANSIKNGNLVLLLWQPETTRRVRGILYNGEEQLRRLAKPLGGVLKNQKLVFRVQFRDIQGAQQHIFDLLAKEL